MTEERIQLLLSPRWYLLSSFVASQEFHIECNCGIIADCICEDQSAQSVDFYIGYTLCGLSFVLT